MQDSHRIKRLHMDNGSEYRNKAFASYCKSRQIKRRFSPSYTPEHNGRAERQMRTLFEATRAQLLQANLTSEFWGMALCNTAYIRNISAHQDLDKTPWELLTGDKPDVSRIRIWGSPAFVHVEKRFRKKTESPGRKCILVGYDLESEMWQFYDLHRNKIIKSWHARIYEHVVEHVHLENLEPVVERFNKRTGARKWDQFLQAKLDSLHSAIGQSTQSVSGSPNPPLNSARRRRRPGPSAPSAANC